MNIRSLQHEVVQNQQKSSWNDISCEIDRDFAGVAIMRYRKKLSDYAEDLIPLYAKYAYDQYELSLDMLPEDEQNELVRLYIEETGRELTECVNGNDFTINNDYTCSLLAMLKNDCRETRERFAEVTRLNILTYYKESLDEVLAIACKDFLYSASNENNLYMCRDMENGDSSWRSY